MDDDDRDEIMRKARFNVTEGRDRDAREYARWLAERGEDEPMTWDPANPKGFRSTAGMSNAEFDAYCRAGKPSLEEPKQSPIGADRGQLHPELVTKEFLYKICGMIGAEVGAAEARLTDKIDPLVNFNPFPDDDDVVVDHATDNVVPWDPKGWRRNVR
jgi:hypothetical protein